MMILPIYLFSISVFWIDYNFFFLFENFDNKHYLEINNNLNLLYHVKVYWFWTQNQKLVKDSLNVVKNVFIKAEGTDHIDSSFTLYLKYIAAGSTIGSLIYIPNYNIIQRNKINYILLLENSKINNTLTWFIHHKL